jgi:hypothetical protein
MGLKERNEPQIRESLDPLEPQIEKKRRDFNWFKPPINTHSEGMMNRSSPNHFHSIKKTHQIQVLHEIPFLKNREHKLKRSREFWPMKLTSHYIYQEEEEEEEENTKI